MVFSYSPGGGLSGLAGCEPTSKRPRAGAESVNCMLYTWFDVKLYLLCAYMYMYVCVYIYIIIEWASAQVPPTPLIGGGVL